MNEHGEWQLSSPEQDANAAFIAAARTALPSLLDENERLRAALREALGMLEAATESDAVAIQLSYKCGENWPQRADELRKLAEARSS